jgi:alkanesulfonate monooxygenase SsuD/methylene tetrahydromethanopterin reductase-like flavin-dependent oxidoreductase (luciferase family)
MAVRLGFFARVRSDERAAESFRAAAEAFRFAEKRGFDTGWIGQEHFRPVAGGLSSPLAFLGHVAALTDRIGLGAGPIDLPTENPIRLAEDAAVVDLLSNGRLQLGLGSTGEHETYKAFGQNADRRVEAFSERLDLLLDALSDRPIGAPANRVHPQAPELQQSVSVATASESGARLAGIPGLGLNLARTHVRTPDTVSRSLGDLQLPLIQAYRAALAPTSEPRIIVNRTLYIAETEGQAVEIARAGIERFAERRVADGLAWPEGSVVEIARRHDALIGSAESLAAQLAEDPVVAEATELVLHFHLVSPPEREVLAGLELVAAELAPRLGWIGAPVSV